MTDHNDIRLTQWLDGTISPEDLALLSQEVDLDHLRTILDRQEEYEIETTEESKSWDKLQAKFHETPKIKKTSRKLLYIIGGLILLGLLAVALLINQGQTTVKAEAEPLLFALEDGSEVNISPGSSIAFDQRRWGTSRKIKLIGQAFFEVEPGVPFVVETISGEVEVLGTSFDVWSPDVDVIEVKCINGSVQVTTKKGSTVGIHANQSVIGVNGRLEAVRNVEEIDWLSGNRVYRNTTIDRISADLERYLGVSISLDGNLGKEKFSGILSTIDTERALSFLCEAMGWTYQLDGTTVKIKSL